MLRPKLNRLWASGSPTLRRDPGDTKYAQGWVAEIPTFQVLNYLQNKIDSSLLALAERGVFEWGEDISYGSGSIAWDETNRTVYVSTVGNPDRTKAPSTNPTQWAASSIQISRSSYDALVLAINHHIADVTSNPHKLTANMIGAYNKSEIDALVTQYKALVKAHVDDKNNPHGTTAAAVGAVPIAGGTYTGDVVFDAGVFFDSQKTTGVSKTGGVFLKNSDAIIGVTDSGISVAGTTTSLSPVVTEQSFPALKQQVEPQYAVPASEFCMPLVGDINIQSGVGSVEDPSPAFNSSLGNCYYYDPLAGKELVGDSSLFNTGNKFTICFDLLSPTPRDPTNHSSVLFVGTKDCQVVGAPSGFYFIKSGVDSWAGYTLIGPVSTWYRFVATYDGTNFTLYVNGVEVAKQAGTAPTGSTNPVNISFATTPSGKRVWNIRNLRIWSQALSNKQVSTL